MVKICKHIIIYLLSIVSDCYYYIVNVTTINLKEKFMSFLASLLFPVHENAAPDLVIAVHHIFLF